MTNRKTTRRALVLSLLSLLLCCSMLVGTTFAWFTDSVTSGKNQIVAGNLDIELEYATKIENGQVTEWTTVKGAEDIFDPNALWEPGRVEVAYLKVSNLGTLALKYQLGVNVTGETAGTNVDGEEFKLSDHLVFAVVEMPDALSVYAEREAVAAAAGTEKGLKDYNGTTTMLDAKGGANDTDYVALVIYMPETVGNEANYRGTTVPTIELGVKLNATQKDVESDSFGSDYDKDAWDEALLVCTEEEMTKALAAGGAIKLGANITSENGFTVEKDASIDLNGFTMTATGTRAYLFTATGDADLTVVNGKMIAESTNHVTNGTGSSTGASSSIRFESTGKLTVKDVQIQGSVRGGHRAIDVYGGTAELNNVDITSEYGAGIVIGGEGVTAVLNDCDITVTGMYSAPYNSVCFGVWGGAEMTVKSGNYKMINNNTYATGDTHGGWVGIVMSSGGTLNINGGTYTNIPAAGFNPAYERAIFELENNSPAVSTLNLNGGTFKPQNDKVYAGYGDKYYPTYNVDGLTKIAEGTWTVVDLDGTTTLPAGAVLDLNGTEVTGTIVAAGDLTIKGDAKIKTLKATNGGTITLEEGKTLELNNFSFGSSATKGAEYTITGGTVKAAYGFFQHGKYNLHSNFETGYMYYSYGSDITLYGTFHSQGKGDGLDYIRGKLTIAAGGKSIHDKSLWVGQPASWGAMNATLVIEEGGYVQANSLSVYEGSALQIEAAGLTAGEVTNIVCNTISNTGTVEAVNNDALTAVVSSNKIVLQ